MEPVISKDIPSVLSAGTFTGRAVMSYRGANAILMLAKFGYPPAVRQAYFWLTLGK